MCSRHALLTIVYNGARRDHDEGDGTLNESVMAASAHVGFSAGRSGQEWAMAGEPQANIEGAKLGGPPDIWADQNSVIHLVSGEMPEGLSQAERDRVHKRVRRFRYGVMQRIFGNRSRQEVPRPAEREGIVQ